MAWVAVLAATASAGRAQTTVDEGVLPAFEYASVFSSHPAAGPIISASPQTGEFSARGVSVLQLLGYAFDVEPASIVGAPEWLATSYYRIEARAAAPASRDGRSMRQSLTGLLFDYFGLEAHRGQAPVYILDVAETGVRIAARSGEAPALRHDGQGRLQGRSVGSKALAAALQDLLARPVLDRSGLAGAYDFDLAWDPADDASLAAAMREQLGLVLRSVPVDVVVVDAVNAQPAEEPGGRLFEPGTPD